MKHVLSINYYLHKINLVLVVVIPQSRVYGFSHYCGMLLCLRITGLYYLLLIIYYFSLLRSAI